MELSIVAPYTNESMDAKYFENLAKLVKYFTDANVKTELIVCCSSSQPKLMHKAHVFTGNLPFSRVAFTTKRDIKSIIACGLNRCNRNTSFIVESNKFYDDVDYLSALTLYNSKRRFDCVVLRNQHNKALGLFGRTFDLRTVAECITATSLKEVVKQFAIFHQRWGTCIECVVSAETTCEVFESDINLKFFEKLKLKKFIYLCMNHYMGYLNKFDEEFISVKSDEDI